MREFKLSVFVAVVLGTPVFGLFFLKSITFYIISEFSND